MTTIPDTHLTYPNYPRINLDLGTQGAVLQLVGQEGETNNILLSPFDTGKVAEALTEARAAMLGFDKIKVEVNALQKGDLFSDLALVVESCRECTLNEYCIQLVGSSTFYMRGDIEVTVLRAVGV